MLNTLLNMFFSWPVLLILVAWSYFWKAWALWLAARNGQRNWFLVLMFLGTLGILEIIYIFKISKKKQ
ncbi:MAG: DUF5652 family protein [Candidatus Parcubacteria bacterium]|nr:DUF5652 family protein [Candidatus Parcubacteria bacterium]